jgi:hypothetical protein
VRASGGDGDGETVCKAPCDTNVPTNYAYRIVGDGLRRSGDFRLSGHDGDHETITVSEATSAGFTSGIAGAVLGGIGIGIGGILIEIGLAQKAVGYVVAADGTVTQDPNNQGSGTETAGIVVIVLSAVVAVTGVVLIVTNARTHVTQDSGDESSGSIPLAAPLAFGSALGVPRATEREVSTPFQDFLSDEERRDRRETTGALALPPPTVAPLISGSF